MIEFNAAVMRDLEGKATEADKKLLDSDPDGWLRYLSVLSKSVEQGLTSERAKSLRKGNNVVAAAEFQAFKAVAMKKKNQIMRRQQEVKALLKEIHAGEEHDRWSVMDAILAELKDLNHSIRCFMERDR